MIKDFKNIAVKLFFFTAIGLIIVISLNSIFVQKNAPHRQIAQSFYNEDKNTLDVVFLGSCHIHYNIMPMHLWQEFGIPSHNFSSGTEVFQLTYYRLKEVLKYQNPSVIVLDVFASAYENTYVPPPTYVKYLQSDFDSLNPSLNKVMAAYTMRKHKNSYKFLLNFMVNKNRDYSLNGEDFTQDNYSMLSNGHILLTTKPAETTFPDSPTTTEILDFDSTQEEYLNKIIKLCKDNDVNILLTASPYFMNDDEQKYFNKVSEIAKNEQIDFINFNLKYDELDLDISDMSDSAHLNYKGCQKYTSAIGDILKNNYGLIDKREDVNYSNWNSDAKIWERESKGKILSSETLFSNYVSHLSDENYIVILTYKGDVFNIDSLTSDMFATIGINKILELYDKNSYISVISNKTILHEQIYPDGAYYKFSLGNHTIDLVSDNRFDNRTEALIVLDGNNISLDANGINIVVYDSILNKFVDSVCVDLAQNNFLTRLSLD